LTRALRTSLTHDYVRGRGGIISSRRPIREEQAMRRMCIKGEHGMLRKFPEHAVHCGDSSDCEFLLTSSGPFKIVPAARPTK